MGSSISREHLWWQRGVIYQVYPRSFLDTNGDGVGDLPGIERKLDYLTWLGVDAIWISPIFPSPMADFGYDVSNYTDIDPLFGTLDDFDRLLTAAHQRNLKLLLDFVPNHSSDQHPWFIESRSSRDNPKRDWYIWRDPAPDGGPPNNWLSHFGGAAWEYDEQTGQYYLHSFLKEQPDLNWRNPDVQQAMFDVLRFWLDRGVDGFRVDVLWHLIKDARFRDNPPNPHYKPDMEPYRSLLPVYSSDQPEIYDIVTLMRAVFDEYDERVIIGEIYLPIEQLVLYYGPSDTQGIHLPFNFQLILLPWDANEIAATIDLYEASLPEHGWPNWVLGNHDRPRIASRVGPAQARVAAMLLLTLRGTPTIYYGDEIGMHDVEIPPDRIQDPEQKNQPGYAVGRDPERTPMQWTAGPNAGFSKGIPWLPIADDYQTINVERERDDPSSMLALHRRLLTLRRDEPALSVGAYAPAPAGDDLLAYYRTWDERRLLVVLNLGARQRLFRPEHQELSGRIVLSTYLDREESVSSALELRADEGVVIELTD